MKPSWKIARELAQMIASEPLLVNGQTVLFADRPLTVAEGILRHWAASPNPKLQMAFMEWAYGTPGEEKEDSHNEVRIIVEYEKPEDHPKKSASKTIANLDLPF